MVPAIDRVDADPDSLSHSPDYRSVTRRGTIYGFSPLQADALRILFEALNAGAPEVGQAYILEQIGSTQKHLKDVFKHDPAWGTLIVRGQRRGTFRLDP